MSYARLFNFDNDFDDKPVVEEPALPPEPTFSGAELVQEKETAYAAGLEEGKRLEKEAIEAQVLQLVSHFEEQLTRFIESDMQKWQQLQTEAAQLAKTIAYKICLTEIEQHAVERVTHCLATTTTMLLSRPKINVHINDAIAKPLSQSLKKMIDAGEIAIVPDETLAIYDCRFQWQEGGTEVILKNIQDQIETYINQLTE